MDNNVSKKTSDLMADRIIKLRNETYKSYVDKLLTHNFVRSKIPFHDGCEQYEINKNELSMIVGFKENKDLYIYLCISDREVNAIMMRRMSFDEMFGIWRNISENMM